MDPTPTALNNSKTKFTMTNLIKIMSKTKIGEGSKKTFAKILLKDMEEKPELIQEYRFLAVLMEVEHLIYPVTNNHVLN